MGKVVVSEDSYLRNLPFSAYRKLMTMLDIGNQWEKMVVFIPKELDMTPENFEPRYGFDHVANFAERGRKYSGSATDAILRDWQTQNTRIKHLIKVLVEAELYAAADYLAVNILHGDPVPRANQSTGTTTRENNLGSPDQRREEKITDGDDLGNVCLPTPKNRKPSGSNGDISPEVKPSQDSGNGNDTVVNAFVDSGTDNDTVVNAFEDHESEAGSVGLEAVPDVGDGESADTLSQNHNKILKNVKYSILENITNKFNEDDLINGGNLLGKGGFGTVFLGKFQSNFHVAIKRLKLSKEVDVDVEKQFNTECHYLTKYRQDNLVQLLGYSNDGPYKCLIYHYMENGSLEDRLQCKDNTPPLSPTQRVAIVKGTAEGIAFLNNHGLVHRDIKSANVLLDKKFTPKLADFATTRTAPQGSGLSKAAATTLVIGTSSYLAPEAFQHDVSTKLDSFSFGVVLLEVLTGLPAYDEQREDKDLSSHVDENCEDIIDMLDISGGEWEDKAVYVIYDVAKKCLRLRKKFRPVVSDIIDDLRNL